MFFPVEKFSVVKVVFQHLEIIMTLNNARAMNLKPFRYIIKLDF